MVKKLSKIIFMATCLIVTGCSFDYNDQSKEVIKSETIPDSEMVNFNLIKIKDNKPVSEISASLAQIYNKKNKTVLLGVEFTEYNSKTSSVATKGTADSVEYYNDTEDAKLTGNLSFYSKKDDIQMKGDLLYWYSDSKTIKSDINSSILVTKEDGSKIEGYGFSANLKNSTFSFEKNVTGITP